MPKQFDLIVFDWDGTLADSTAIIAQALQSACRDLGEPVPDDVAARFVIGLGLADTFALIAPQLASHRHGELRERYRHHYLARDATVPLFPGARELLDDLRRAGHRLAVATGKSRVGLDRSLIGHLLVDHFHATRCADEGRPKPHPDMLLHLMARLRVAPERTLMIGDTTHDLELARAAGTHAVGVAYGAHELEGLVAAKPLAIVHSIAELATWLRTHG